MTQVNDEDLGEEIERLAAEFFTEDELLLDPILKYFHFNHTGGQKFNEVVYPFCYLAHVIITGTPRNPERTVALRKLLEAKDACVRANMN